MKNKLNDFYTDLIEFKAKYSYQCEIIEHSLTECNPLKNFFRKKIAKEIDKEYGKIIRKYYFKYFKGRIKSLTSFPLGFMLDFDAFQSYHFFFG